MQFSSTIIILSYQLIYLPHKIYSIIMETSVVTIKGQMVVPAKVRKKYGLKKGTKVVIMEKEEGFMVQPLDKKYFEQFAGILPGKGKATKALLEERRKDKEREDSHT